MKSRNKVVLFLLMTFVGFSGLSARATQPGIYEDMERDREENGSTPFISPRGITYQIRNDSSEPFEFALVPLNGSITPLTSLSWESQQELDDNKPLEFNSLGATWCFEPDTDQDYISVTLSPGRSILLRKNQTTVRIFDSQIPRNAYFEVRWASSSSNNNTRQTPWFILNMEFSAHLLTQHTVEMISDNYRACIQPAFQRYEFESLQNKEKKVIRTHALINLLASLIDRFQPIRPVAVNPERNPSTSTLGPVVSFIYKPRTQLNPKPKNRT